MKIVQHIIDNHRYIMDHLWQVYAKFIHKKTLETININYEEL